MDKKLLRKKHIELMKSFMLNRQEKQRAD
ncbi:5-formyltetrahydrofolate cyclo-ligase, partial [Staphylococcus saprophyticus]